jgi:hypothetical protein
MSELRLGMLVVLVIIYGAIGLGLIVINWRRMFDG